MRPRGELLDEAAVRELGRRLARSLTPPAFVTLQGPLGAGKSVLARALGRELGVRGSIPSPTYPLLLRHELPGGGSFVHLDLYRLDDPEQIWELGWEELPGPDEVVVVEWPERAGGHLPEVRVDVRLAPSEDDPKLRRVIVGGEVGR